MLVRCFIAVTMFASLGILAGCSQPDVRTMTEAQLIEYAKGIHERVITIDTHDDIPFNFATDAVDPADPESDRQMTLPKMREGGLNVGFFVVYHDQTARTPELYQAAKDSSMKKFDGIHRMAEKLYPDQIEIAYTADDIERIHNSGKLVACIGIENGFIIGKDLSLLKTYYDLGARYITLSHGGHNDICDSATPDPGEPVAEHNGVSEFGKQVIAEMNRLGIMVDISHISKKSALDAMELSQAPVIASHSSTKALSNVARNLDDETLLALKANGGVMQTVALTTFVNEKKALAHREAVNELRERIQEELGFQQLNSRELEQLAENERSEYERKLEEFQERIQEGMAEVIRIAPPVDVKDFVDHIDYAIKLMGIDHVAISSDFDGGGGIEGWNDAGETFNVTLELVRRGYTEEQVRKIWGGNTLRVLGEVEKVAAELQKKQGN